MTAAAPRCPVPACPVRYRGGPDRPCPEHQADAADLHQLAAELLAAPGGTTGKAAPVWQPAGPLHDDRPREARP